jgi:hypothetical protein
VSLKFPTREVCDLDNPQEMFLHLLVALPMNKYRVAFPVSYLRLVSERFHELGAFMRCPECGHVEEPKVVWSAPKSATPHWLSDPGSWKRDGKAPAPRKFETVIPTRAQCDLRKPGEMFAWMFAGLPLMRGAPMLFDAEWASSASQHLADGGAMLFCPCCGYEKAPEKEYVPPNLSGPHWLTDPGEWVPAGQKPAPSLEQQIDASLVQMSARQQAELFKALIADEEGRELPDTPAGKVVSTLSEEQRAAVLRRLRERDTA